MVEEGRGGVHRVDGVRGVQVRVVLVLFDVLIIDFFLDLEVCSSVEVEEDLCSSVEVEEDMPPDPPEWKPESS